jgi:hypothetical protein
MSDLVKRLRQYGVTSEMILSEDIHAAADTIEAAEARAERLRAELQMVLDEFGYSLPPDTKASIAAAIRAAAGGGE